MSSSSPFSYLLRFRLNADVPLEAQEKYKKNIYIPLCGRGMPHNFVPHCDPNIYIARWLDILEHKNIGTPTDRQLLNRCEGGIGGDSNVTNRQIRFYNERENYSWKRFGEITLCAIPSDDGTATWTPTELVAFGKAFVQVIEYYITCEGVDFYIAIDLNCG